MHVERMLGQRARADFQHHRGEFARRVVILLHRVGQALAGGKVDRALAGHGKGGGTALGGVFTLALDRDFRVAPDVQFAHREGFLVQFPPLGGRGDRVKNASLGDTCLDRAGHQLVAVDGDRDAGIFGLGI